MSLVGAEYSGLAFYPLDQFPPINMQYNAGTLTTSSGTSVTSNDVAVAIGFVGNDSGASSTYTATGYTARASAVTSNNRTSIGLLDKTIASPTAGVTATVTSGSLDGVGFIMLRSVLPSIGSVQQTFCTNSASVSISCSLGIGATGGDLGIVTVFAGSSSDVGDTYMPQISGLCAVPWKSAPTTLYGVPPGGFLSFYCPNITASATTVTLTEYSAGTGNQTWDVMLSEVVGLANSSPITGATFNFTDAVTTNTNSLTIPAGTYYLYNVFGDAYSPNTYTNTGTAVVSRLAVGGNYLKQLNDTVVSSGTYTSTVTSSHVQSQSYNLFIAFSTTNQTGANIAQVTNGGGFAGAAYTEKTFPLPVVAGHTLVAIGVWQSAQTSTGPTDTLGNTWVNICGGGAGHYYGAWEVASSAAGMDTVTLNPSSITTSMKLFELSSITALDTSTCSQLTGTSISPNQITTAQANELLISFAVNSGACNPPLISLANSGNLISVGGSGSHCAQGAEVAQFTTSIGTYGNPATSASSSTMAAGIFGFEGSAPAVYMPAQISGNAKFSGNIKVQ